jgi:hypothetical protein
MNIAACLAVPIALAACVTSASFAQTAPSATEAFNLGIQCKEMARQKFLDVRPARPITYSEGAVSGMSAAQVDQLNLEALEVLGEAEWSHYNPKTNRCYIEIYLHNRHRKPPLREEEWWYVYDAQTDDVLGYANVTSAGKWGVVYDHKYAARKDGWDAAMAYIEAVMVDPN